MLSEAAPCITDILILKNVREKLQTMTKRECIRILVGTAKMTTGVQFKVVLDIRGESQNKIEVMWSQHLGLRHFVQQLFMI